MEHRRFSVWSDNLGILGYCKKTIYLLTLSANLPSPQLCFCVFLNRFQMCGSGWCMCQLITIRRHTWVLLARRNSRCQNVKETDSETCTEQQEEWTGTQEGWAGSTPGHRKGPQEPASRLRGRSRVCQFLQSAPGAGAQTERSAWRWVRARKGLCCLAVLCHPLCCPLPSLTLQHTSLQFHYTCEAYFQTGDNCLSISDQDSLIGEHVIFNLYAHFSPAHSQ